MAMALTRMLGTMRLGSTPRMLATVPRIVPIRPRFSFADSIRGTPIQRTELEWRLPSVVNFATTTRCGTKSAEKRHRQSEKRRMRNKSRKSEIKTRMKKVFKALDVYRKEGPNEISELDAIAPLIREAQRAIDEAVGKGTLHRNTGARRKSRLFRARNSVLIKAGLMTPTEKPKPPSLVEVYEERKAARRAALKKMIQEQLEQQQSIKNVSQDDE